MTDVGRLNAIQDHAREGDDVGEGLAVKGAHLQSCAEFGDRPPDVLIALEEVADHPEIVLSRREILFASLSADVVQGSMLKNQ